MGDEWGWFQGSQGRLLRISRVPQERVFVVRVMGRVSLPFMGTPPQIALGSLGMADSLILMVLALVVFGPRRLPQIGRQIGKLMYEFRKASNDFKFQMEEELRLAEEADKRKKEEEQRKQLAATQPAQESVSATPDIVKAMESPYPGEGMNPETIAAEETARPDDETPRIMPPSTGETVASTRVAVNAELTEPDQASKIMSNCGNESVLDPMGQVEQPAPAVETTSPAGDENAPATEAVSRNG
jgi:sec-independent protein translocase protein TatB